MATIKKSKDISKLARELQQPESKIVLDEMTSMSESPEYQKSTPPDSQAQLSESIRQARELYGKEANKNEWLEVAQNLAGAVAQFGAASQGMRTGANLSNINTGPNVDWQGRTERARKDFLESVRQAEGDSNRERQAWEDTEAQKKGTYTQKFQPLSERLRNAQQIENDEARFRREQIQEGLREKKDKEKSDLAERKFNDQDLARQEQELQKKQTAALTLTNQIINDPDMKKADRDKIQAKYGAVAAQAGIDPETLANISEQSKDAGIFGTGLLRGEDKAKKTTLLNEQVLAPLKTQLEAIRARREALRKGGSISSDSSGNNSAPTVESKRDSTIEKYASDNKLSYDQAKKVLINRGYEPKE